MRADPADHACVPLDFGRIDPVLYLKFWGGLAGTQGDCQNYEMPGAPRTITGNDAIGAWRPKGFINLALAKSYLDVVRPLAGARVRLGELSSLEPGHVLDVGMPIDSPVTTPPNGKPHFQGGLQVIGSRIAMRVQ